MRNPITVAARLWSVTETLARAGEHIVMEAIR